jgi:DNA-directed RNA polymerase subunit E'/Rpb7
MDNIFYRVLLSDKVKIEPRYLSKDYRSYVASKLKGVMEGICTKHGFIKEGSIELYKVAPGNIELIGLNGNIVYDVYYYADICNPLIGNVIKATVTNVNKFGILAEVSNILEIIIAKNSVNITHDTGVDLDSIQIGNQIMVEVIGKKFELNDKKISIVGKLVTGASSVKKKMVKEERVVDDDDDVDIDVIPEVGDGDGDGEDAEEDEEKEEKEEDEDELEVDELELDEDEEEYQKGGNEFFDSDEEVEEDAFEFYSDEEGEAEGGDVDGEDDWE